MSFRIGFQSKDVSRAQGMTKIIFLRPIADLCLIISSYLCNKAWLRFGRRTFSASNKIVAEIIFPLPVRPMSRQSVFRKIAAWLVCVLPLIAHCARSDTSPMASTREASIAFALPPQPLAEALATFSTQTGYSVLVESELAENRRTAGVYGELAPRDALQRLLTGTGLVARYSGGNAFSLMRAEKPEPAAVEAGQSPLASLPFGTALQVSLTRALCRAQPDEFGRYRVGLQLWINEDGRVIDVRLLGAGGDKRRDTDLVMALRGLVLDASPPAELAQPVTILLTPRSDPADDCRRFNDGVG